MRTFVAATLLSSLAGCTALVDPSKGGGGPGADTHDNGSGGSDPGGGGSGSATPAVTGDDLANLALANLGGTACGTNSLGDSSFTSSCYGNGGQPEFWCADFVRWVWNNGGFDTSELTAAAGSFYVYGQNHGTLSSTPTVGAAVVFDSDGGGYADHVAIGTRENGDGSIEPASGDWNGQSGSEAYFSSTSHVVLNAPAYDSSVGSEPGVIGMTISGYITPAGVSTGGPGTGGTGDAACSVHADGRLYSRQRHRRGDLRVDQRRERRRRSPALEPELVRLLDHG